MHNNLKSLEPERVSGLTSDKGSQEAILFSVIGISDTQGLMNTHKGSEALNRLSRLIDGQRAHIVYS